MDKNQINQIYKKMGYRYSKEKILKDSLNSENILIVQDEIVNDEAIKNEVIKNENKVI